MKTLIFNLILVTTGFVFQLHAQGISSTEAAQLLKKDKNIVVLDVRTENEFKSGHIAGAKNIDITQSDATAKIDKLNPEATYIVHCRSARRSAKAVDYMQKKGFKKVYEIKDGFAGWEGNKLPVVK